MHFLVVLIFVSTYFPPKITVTHFPKKKYYISKNSHVFEFTTSAVTF